MDIKRFFAAMLLSAAICLSAAVGTAFAEDGISEDELEAEEVSLTDEIRRGEGYYICAVIYQDDIDSICDENGECCALIGEIDGNLKEGETKEFVKKEAAEDVRYTLSAAGAGEYPFDVYVYLYDDYDYSPEEFLDFVSEDVLVRKNESTAPNLPTGAPFPFAPAACASAAAACIARINKRKL